MGVLALLLPRPPCCTRSGSLALTAAYALRSSSPHSSICHLSSPSVSLLPSPRGSQGLSVHTICPLVFVSSFFCRGDSSSFVFTGGRIQGAMGKGRAPAQAKASFVSEVGLTKPAVPVVPEIGFQLSTVDCVKWTGDLLVVGVFEGSAGKSEKGEFQNSQLKWLDEHVGGLLGEITTEEDFTGKSGQSTYARIPGYGFKRVGLVGLGKVESLGASSKVWRTLGETMATAAKTAQARSAAVVVVDGAKLSEEVKLAAASTITTGVLLGSFEDTRFKSESKKPLLKSVELLGLGSSGEIERQIGQTVQQSAGIILAKQLVNAPPNVLIPSVLADEAENIAVAHGDVITAKILDKEQCEELKMGAYLGVAAASTNPPKFIHLRYSPPSGTVTTKLAIVGKGLTFDSGGYNLKTGPGCMIELMKFDMGGAAAVLGCAKAIASIKPPGVEVNFIVAACENMISGGGMRPGDILTASNGKTIEVNNTDAEGRLTLADALVYANSLKVDKIVDLATLTGACIIALGNEIGGMFTPSDELAEELTAASKKGGEKFWRMPMEDGYWEMMKSNIADMVNTGGRAGGSITAALFLKQFVDEKLPWAHLDIAGPVWKDKTGGTGFAVATLVEWVVMHKTSS